MYYAWVMTGNDPSEPRTSLQAREGMFMYKGVREADEGFEPPLWPRATRQQG